MSGDEGAGTSQQSSGQESAQFLATEIKGLPCFNPRDDPNTLSIRRLTYIYGQKGSQWIRRK